MVWARATLCSAMRWHSSCASGPNSTSRVRIGPSRSSSATAKPAADRACYPSGTNLPGSPRHGFEGEPQERTRLDLEADRHDGIGSLLQPQAKESFVSRAKGADLAADRQQALAVAACLRRIEFHLVLLLVVDIPAHGAAGTLLQQSRQLQEKRGRRLVRRVWPGILAPIDAG